MEIFKILAITQRKDLFYNIMSAPYKGKGEDSILRHFQQLRSYHDETKWEEILYSLQLVPRGLLVGESPKKGLYNAKHFYSNQGTGDPSPIEDISNLP